MKAIEINGLCKRYGDLQAVSDLTLDIEQGELFSLLGVNGAGKTTTIRMLTGITHPDRGDARLMGHSVCTDRTAAKRCANVSPQESAVAPKLSVRENLDLIARIYEMPDAQARVDEIIGEFELGEVAGRRAGKLSGGWQRRLSIAMALISRPEILFLDEPTLGLDVLARRELWHLVKRLHGRVTILMTTHYLEEAEALSDRIGIMQKGRLNAVGTAAELMARTGKANFEDAFIALAAPEEGEIK